MDISHLRPRALPWAEMFRPFRPMRRVLVATDGRYGEMMKRTLIWTCSFMLAVTIGLHVHARYSADPLAVAFDRIEVGMNSDEACAIIGRWHDTAMRMFHFDENGAGRSHGMNTGWRLYWSSEEFDGSITIRGGIVEAKSIHRRHPSIVDKVRECVCDPASLWRPDPALPVIFTGPINRLNTVNIR